MLRYLSNFCVCAKPIEVAHQMITSLHHPSSMFPNVLIFFFLGHVCVFWFKLPLYIHVEDVLSLNKFVVCPTELVIKDTTETG